MKALFTFLLLVSMESASAAPSRRPLPPEILDVSEDFQILRDHAESRLFYLAPKRMHVKVSSLDALTASSDMCDAVDLYHRLEKRIAEGYVRLAELALAGDASAESKLRLDLRRLEAELDGFSERVVKQVGEAKVAVALPASLASQRKPLGFRDTDTLRLPELAALELSPPNYESLNLPRRLRALTEIGTFDATWNVKPLDLREGLFGFPTFPEFAELRAFPEEIVVTQPVSRLTYCALKAVQQKFPARLVIPLRVNYVLPLWEDERGPQLTDWVAYARKLGGRKWDIVSQLPAADPEIARLAADAGEPRFYSGRGSYRPARFDVNFVSKTSVNKESGK